MWTQQGIERQAKIRRRKTTKHYTLKKSNDQNKTGSDSNNSIGGKQTHELQCEFNMG